MWALSIRSPSVAPVVRLFLEGEVTIGSRADNDIVLAGADERHARIVVKSARYIMVDLKSETGTRVGERRLTSPMIVRSGDRIDIANHLLGILDIAPKRGELRPAALDATEEALLDALNAGDDHSRAVYADLLESRGEHERAELLRIIDQNRIRVLELMIGTNAWWRMRIARPPIEHCADHNCPRTWNAFRGRGAVRSCATCERDVRYCVDVAEAVEHMSDNSGVVLDPLSLRWARDLVDDRRR